jgi:hypothetical protein
MEATGRELATSGMSCGYGAVYLVPADPREPL